MKLMFKNGIIDSYVSLDKINKTESNFYCFKELLP